MVFLSLCSYEAVIVTVGGLIYDICNEIVKSLSDVSVINNKICLNVISVIMEQPKALTMLSTRNFSHQNYQQYILFKSSAAFSRNHL